MRNTAATTADVPTAAQLGPSVTQVLLQLSVRFIARTAAKTPVIDPRTNMNRFMSRQFDDAFEDELVFEE
jgi:hypothetical protein